MPRLTYIGLPGLRRRRVAAANEAVNTHIFYVVLCFKRLIIYQLEAP